MCFFTAFYYECCMPCHCCYNNWALAIIVVCSEKLQVISNVPVCFWTFRMLCYQHLDNAIFCQNPLWDSVINLLMLLLCAWVLGIPKQCIVGYSLSHSTTLLMLGWRSHKLEIIWVSKCVWMIYYTVFVMLLIR